MKKRKGFTLIELLIVIAIILILIAIALPNFLEAQIRAQVTRVRGDLRTVGTAMASYLLDWGQYPPDHDPSEARIVGFGASGLFQLTTPLTYLTVLPEDGFNQGGSGLQGDETRHYEMASTGTGPLQVQSGLIPVYDAYVVWSRGPDVQDDFNDNDGWPLGTSGSGNPCPTTCGYLNYAPTNGSKSRGDLVQKDGDLQIGSYCVDHWQWVLNVPSSPKKRIGLSG